MTAFYEEFKNLGQANYNWRPPNLSELTPIIFNMELTHFGLEASNYFGPNSIYYNTYQTIYFFKICTDPK